MGEGEWIEPVIKARMFHLKISEGPVPGEGGYKAVRIGS